MAMAMMLSHERRRRAVILPQNIWTKAKGPSKVSFIESARQELYHSVFRAVKETGSRLSKLRAEFCKKYFALVNLNRCVDKLVEKERSRKANYTILSSLKRIAQFLCSSLPKYVTV